MRRRKKKENSRRREADENGECQFEKTNAAGSKLLDRSNQSKINMKSLGENKMKNKKEQCRENINMKIKNGKEINMAKIKNWKMAENHKKHKKQTIYQRKTNETGAK